MTEATKFLLYLGPVLLTLVIACGVNGFALGQTPSDDFDILRRDPILPRDLGIGRINGDSSLLSRSSRVRLFCMPSAAPVTSLVSDPDPLPDDAGPTLESISPDTGEDSRVLVTLAADNPFFDFRRPGDPGGVGYYKLHSQWLLVDTSKSGVSLGLEAVTPAGLENDGLQEGPTVLSPHFAWFYEVAPGTAIQGFVGKNLRTRPGWSDGLQRNIHYGLALQSPCPGFQKDPDPAVHLFLEALGRYHFEGDPSLKTSESWKLLPGVHCRMGDNWWLAGGLLMPLAAPRLDSRLWQITCSWQF